MNDNGTGTTEYDDPYRILELNNHMLQARRLADLMEEEGWTTQAEAAEHIGINAWKVSDLLRLLQLPEDKQAEVEAGELAMYTALDWLREHDTDQKQPATDGQEEGNALEGSGESEILISEVQLLAGSLTLTIAPLDDVLYVTDYDEQRIQVPAGDLPTLRAGLRQAGDFIAQLAEQKI